MLVCSLYDSWFMLVIPFRFTDTFLSIILDHCSEAPNTRVVYNLLRDRAYQWNDIGRELGLPFGYHEGLKRDILQTNDEYKLESVIMEWEQSQCSDVTWSNVIRVLKILQFNDLIEPTKDILRRLSGNHTIV